MTDHYDLAIVGTGPGGYVAALKAGQIGAKVAVIEKHHLGGTCLNYGCIPSKALLTSAELLHQIQHADKWGLQVEGKVSHDWAKIQKHKDKVIRQLRGGIKSLLKGRQVTLYEGLGTLNGQGRVAVRASNAEDQVITADNVILATGSVPSRIPGWPDDPHFVCTSDEAVHWDHLPKRLLIVGGGVIGCEFACMMQPFGVEVTVVEMLPGLLPGLDSELGQALERTFTARGITCHTDTKVEELAIAGDHVRVLFSNGKSLEVDRVLVATGRRPEYEKLGTGNRRKSPTSPRGFVTVDDACKRTCKGYYCIGDANGRCLLAHAASAHGVIAAENALGPKKMLEAPIPSAVYTFPEIGAVGSTTRTMCGPGVAHRHWQIPPGSSWKSDGHRSHGRFCEDDPPSRNRTVAGGPHVGAQRHRVHCGDGGPAATEGLHA